MSCVIKATMSNIRHPEYGQITVPFPLTRDNYEEIIEKLEAMRIGDDLNQDCRIDELDDHCIEDGLLDPNAPDFDETIRSLRCQGRRRFRVIGRY